MSESAEAIKEFVVSLGWQSDEQQQAKFFEAIDKSVASVMKAGAAMAGLALSTLMAVNSISGELEKLHYASKMIDADPEKMRALSKELQQNGLSAESADAAIVNFGRGLQNLRFNESWLKSFGTITRDEKGKLLDPTELMQNFFKTDAWRERTHQEKNVLAGQIGLNEEQWMALEESLRNKTNEYQRLLDHHFPGGTFKGATEQSVKFRNAWRSLADVVDVIREKSAFLVSPSAQSKVEHFTHWLEEHSSQIATKLAAVGEMLLNFGEKLLKALEWLFEFSAKADRWLKSITGIDDLFTKIVSAISILVALSIPALVVAIGVVVSALPPLVALLSMASLGSTAGGVAAIAAALAAIGFAGYEIGKSAGEGEFEPDGQGGFRRRSGGGGGGGGDAGDDRPKGDGPPGGFWTKDNIKAGVEYLMQKGGFTREGAIGAIARMSLESGAKGPYAYNASSGARGIFQGLGARKRGMTDDYFQQLDMYIDQARYHPDTAATAKAGKIFTSTRSLEEAAEGGSYFERATPGYSGPHDMLYGSTVSRARRIQKMLDEDAAKPPAAWAAKVLPGGAQAMPYPPGSTKAPVVNKTENHTNNINVHTDNPKAAADTIAERIGKTWRKYSPDASKGGNTTPDAPPVPKASANTEVGVD